MPDNGSYFSGIFKHGHSHQCDYLTIRALLPFHRFVLLSQIDPQPLTRQWFLRYSFYRVIRVLPPFFAIVGATTGATQQRPYNRTTERIL